MIIKYSNTLILSEWDNGNYGCYRRTDDTAVIIISGKKFNSGIFFFEKPSNYEIEEDIYHVKFIYQLYYLNEVFQNKNIKTELQNIKNDVDCFLIRMSKILTFT